MKQLLLSLLFISGAAFGASSSTDTILVPKTTSGNVIIRTSNADRITTNSSGTTTVSGPMTLNGLIDPAGGFGTTTDGAASASTSGLVTTGAQVFAGVKSFPSGLQATLATPITYVGTIAGSGYTGTSYVIDTGIPVSDSVFNYSIISLNNDGGYIGVGTFGRVTGVYLGHISSAGNKFTALAVSNNGGFFRLTFAQGSVVVTSSRLIVVGGAY